MSCLAQTGTGDLLLTVTNGAKRLTLVTSPSQCAAQKLTNRFLLFQGEWFLDTRVGLAYFTFIAQKNPQIPALQQYLSKVVLSIPWIASINFLTVALNAQRKATVALSANTNDSAVIVGGPGNSFIVQPGS